jgi:hypothetical protein
MVLITAAAQSQLEALERHYDRLNRDLATIRMTEAVAMAAGRIEDNPGPFWAAPRPYPDLSDLGWRWLKEGRYWVAFAGIPGGHAITGVFFDTANIPARTRAGDG